MGEMSVLIFHISPKARSLIYVRQERDARSAVWEIRAWVELQKITAATIGDLSRLLVSSRSS